MLGASPTIFNWRKTDKISTWAQEHFGKETWALLKRTWITFNRSYFVASLVKSGQIIHGKCIFIYMYQEVVLTIRFEQSFLALSFMRTTWTPFHTIRLWTNGSSKYFSTCQVIVWMWFFVLNNMLSSHLKMVSAMLIACSVQSSENQMFWTAIASQPSDHIPLVWAILYQPIKSNLFLWQVFCIRSIRFPFTTNRRTLMKL